MREVLATSRSFGRGAVDLVSEAAALGLNITAVPSHHSLAELAPHLATAEAWIVGTGPVTAEHMNEAPHLKVIARYGVGVDAVDLEAARDRGIVVTNTPGANSGAVADLTLALMLNSLRHVTHGDRQVRDLQWHALAGRELSGLTVGIIGFGRIGQGVAQRVKGFGAHMLGVDPFVPAEVFDRSGVEPSTLELVFEKCDVVTLHSPGGQVLGTKNRLSMMKPGSVLINTARADLVDENALAAALRARSVGAYATDVLDGDPAAADSPLLAKDLMPYVTVTPHLGAQTVEAVDKMGQMALANVAAVLRGDSPLNPVTSY